MESYLKILTKYPKLIISLILLITLLMGYFSFQIEINNSIESVLDKDSPALEFDREVKEEFDSREMILIGVISDDGIFNKRTLSKVKEISKAVKKVNLIDENDLDDIKELEEKLPDRYSSLISNILENNITIEDKGLVNNLLYEVKNDSINSEIVSRIELLKLKLNPVSDIISLSEADNITSSEWGLNVETPLKQIPSSDSALTAFKNEIYSNDMFVNGLVSKDGKGTMILVEMSFYYDDYPSEASLLFERLKKAIEPFNGPEEINLAGVPMVNVYTGEYMTRDLFKLTPLVLLLVIIILYASLRLIRGVLLSISVVVVSLVWTLGLMALTGRPITLIVTAMPVMLVAIGIADGIHLITEYKLAWIKYRSNERAIRKMMKELTKPVLLTSLTTMAGFLSLSVSNIESIKDFGIFTAFGVIAAMIFSLTFIPAALILFKEPRINTTQSELNKNILTKFLDKTGYVIIQNRKIVAAGFAVLGLVSAFYITKINVGSTMVGNFHKESEIYQASEMINNKFGGTEVLNIVIDTKEKDGLKNPVVLRKIAELENKLNELPVVGYTTSLAGYIKRINLVMNNYNDKFNRIPFTKDTVAQTEYIEENGKEKAFENKYEINGRDLISQYILLYENAGGENLNKLADYDYSKANLIIQIRDDDTPVLREVKKTAEQFVKTEFAGIAEVTYAGCSNLCIVADEQIIPSQLKSLAIAFGIVFIMLIAIFKSFKLSTVAILPLLMTSLFAFFLLGAFGIYLDAATALVASIILGIGIDYSIHFISRYKLLIQEGKDSNLALIESLNTSGRPIIFNAAAVTIGFLVLVASSFWPVINIGWLVAVNMVLSALFSLILISALLGRSKQIKEGDK